MSVNHNPPAGRDVPGDLIGLGAARVGPAPAKGQRRKSTLLRWIMCGRLRGWRSNGRWLVSRSELEEFLRPLPVQVPLRPEAVAAARRAETDAVLRKHGLR